jgi:hypothetical protein
MIVNHQHRYIFISVPKTGSISTQVSLGFAHDIPEPDLYHQGIATVLANHPQCLDYFKFAFVRNPWARLLSLYKDFTLKRVNQYSALVKHDQPLFGEFRDFEDFCLRVKESPWWNDIFLRSQHRLLSVDGNPHIMDFVGRFESLQTDFDEVCKRLNLGPVPLLKMNTGHYDNTAYRQFYSEASRTAVANLYADDIERFNYEF